MANEYKPCNSQNAMTTDKHNADVKATDKHNADVKATDKHNANGISKPLENLELKNWLETHADQLEKKNLQLKQSTTATSVGAKNDFNKHSAKNRLLMNELKNQPEILKEAKNKAEKLYQRAKVMKFKQFSAGERLDLKKSVLEMLEKRVLYGMIWEQINEIINDGNNVDMEAFEFDLIMDFLLNEMKTLTIIEKRQNAQEKLQELKQKYYTLSNTDTCKQFIKKLSKEADGLKDDMERKKLNQLFPDLYKVLIHLIEKIKSADKNSTTQIALESVSGVLSLGSAVASGAIGAVAIASTAASSTASAASTTANVAGATASKAATGASEASNLVGSTISKTTQVVVTSSKTGLAAQRSIQTSITIAIQMAPIAEGANTVSTIIKVGKGIATVGGIIKEAITATKAATDCINTKKSDSASENEDIECDEGIESDEDVCVNESEENESSNVRAKRLALQIYKKVMRFNEQDKDGASV